MNTHFEFLGEDRDYPGAKIYSVEAIHVTTTRNKRKYTESELREAGRSLSFRPLNINHDTRQSLPFPENCTLFMEFDNISKSVKGKFRIFDQGVSNMIDNNRINQVSIEQLPTKGETCNEISCEQHGVAFIGLALLESDVLPGDNHANIIKESYTITEITISNEQRKCIKCTEFEACDSCKHKGENDSCVEKCISVKKKNGITINDEILAQCVSKCGKTSKDEAWRLYRKFELYKD